MSADPRPAVPASAGRRADAARSAARSRCRPTWPPRSTRCRRGPTRSTRRRCRRRGTAPEPRARASSPAGPRWRRRRTAPPPRRAVITSGSTPRIARTPVTNSSRLRGVPGGAGGDHPDAARRRAGRSDRRSPAGRRRCGPARPGRARRSGPRPAPSRTISIRRTRSTSARLGRCRRSSSRIELVPQSTAATRGSAHAPSSSGGHPRRTSTHGPPATSPAAAPAPRRRAGSRPGRPRGCGPTRACRHFTRSGMPPAPGDTGQRARGASRRAR